MILAASSSKCYIGWQGFGDEALLDDVGEDGEVIFFFTCEFTTVEVLIRTGGERPWPTQP